ncbi:MAG: PorP/SprF family type IX secretion system membrane protein [Flavobacteriales bacterium]|nr:PorP/SprF family type IX secretion system membrane protein [Flavobacteriales bacterium]
MRKLLLSVFIGVMGWTSAHAQDPTFTQFYANRTYINPAYAGADMGLRFNMNYRNLWTAVPGDFSTYSAGVDIGDPNIFGGIGFLAAVGNEGEGRLQTQRYSLMYSYRLIVIPRSFDIHFGVDAAYMSKEIKDWNAFVFSDQLHPIYGNINPSSVQQPDKLKIVMPDFNAGMLARFNLTPGGGRMRSRKTISNTIGFAAHHITQPNESLTGRTEKLPIRFLAHYTMMVSLSKVRSRNPFYLSPNIMYEHQRTLSTLNVGMYAMRAPVMIGLWYRNEFKFESNDTDALMFNIGMRGTNRLKTFMYQIGYSYDLTLSKLAGSTSGSHEIALILELTRASFNKKSAIAKKRARNCYNWHGPGTTPKVF